MTGFASLTREDEAGTVAVTIRALNHRYLDLQVRLPSAVAGLESRIRAIVQRHVARGRIEFNLGLQLRRAPAIEVELNEEFGAALGAALDTARDRGLVSGTLAPGDLLRLPQALTIRERQADPDEAAGLEARIEALVDEALGQLDAMRVREGEHLRADLDHHRDGVADLVEQLARAADEGRGELEARLRERVRQMAADLADPALVAQEIVKLAARSDISEEIARFRAHVAHWRALAGSAEPCGRKLDFLLQEMNREVNTMGSKADGLRVSEMVIAAKAGLERLREQVQNVE
ncbi:MAG TPA: YicC/YloC family endoribonuclease [Vicinamibacterales bacterium]|nr:YicC/YloC family endoribonuclease [Vicinamibacterales bacterium]